MNQNKDIVGVLKIHLPLSFAALSVMLTATLTWIQFSIDEKYKPILGFLVQAIGSNATAVGAFYALKTLNLNGEALRLQSMETQNIQNEVRLRQQQEKKMDRANQYMDKWDEPHMASARDTIREIMDTPLVNGESRRNRVLVCLERRPEVKKDITVVLNLLEKIAIAVEKDIVDAHVIKDFYMPIVPEVWEFLRAYADDLRDRKGVSTIYLSLENLDKSWKEGGNF